MPRSRANTASTLRVGSQPLSGASRSRPRSFPSLSGNEAPKINLLENTKLHQAVANRQFEAIDNIVLLDPNIITIKNKQGETAADWFLEYLHQFFHFEDPEVIKLLPEEIHSGNVKLVEDYLENNGSLKLRFSEGNTLLHLAIEYNQLKIVKLILNHISPQLMNSLLAMENFHGVNPKELSNKLNNPEMINLLQDLSSISTQPGITTVSSESLVPPISKHSFKNIEKSTDLLTDLCCASYWILKQALETTNKSMVTPSIEQNLLAKLFSLTDITNNTIQLQKNIQEAHKFFKKLIQEESVYQKIKINTEMTALGIANKNNDLIYINPLKCKNDIAGLISTLIHESSHIIHSSYDFNYCKSYEKNPWKINFSDCEQLLKNNDSVTNLTSEKLALLKIQHLLEGKKLSFNNWLAHHNADTFTVAVLGLAAFGWNCAEVEDSNLLINGNRFLTALSNYSYQLQPTTKPRSPDPPSETLLSPMASSDHPENPKLLGKIRRIFLKATKKTPSIPRASSHASTAASSSPPQSPESNLNPKTPANSLTAGIVTLGIGEDRLSVFPPTLSTSPPDQIAATPDNLLKPGHHPGQLNFANRARY